MKNKFELQTAILTKTETKILKSRFIEASNKTKALELVYQKYKKLAKRLKMSIFKQHNHYSREIIITNNFNKFISIQVL
jgi:acetolactate synthase small subunit